MQTEPTGYYVEIVFAGLGLDDEVSLKALDLARAVAATRAEDGTVVASALVSAHSAEEAARTFIDGVTSHAPSATPIQAERDLVGITDIAERVGVTREAVRNWAGGKRRGGEFPRPVGVLGGDIKVWAWGTVNAWLDFNLRLGDGLRHPTLYELGSIDRLIGELRRSRSDAD